MHEIPYLNLRGIHDNIKEELDQAYREVMDREWFIGGEADRRFEQEFAAYCGAKACGNWKWTGCNPPDFACIWDWRRG